MSDRFVVQGVKGKTLEIDREMVTIKGKRPRDTRAYRRADLLGVDYQETKGLNFGHLRLLHADTPANPVARGSLAAMKDADTVCFASDVGREFYQAAVRLGFGAGGGTATSEPPTSVDDAAGQPPVGEELAAMVVELAARVRELEQCVEELEGEGD